MKTVRKALLFLVAIASASALVACEASIGIGDDCIDDLDCPDGTFCDPDGFCEEFIDAGCIDDADCDIDAVCDPDNGYCYTVAVADDDVVVADDDVVDCSDIGEACDIDDDCCDGVCDVDGACS